MSGQESPPDDRECYVLDASMDGIGEPDGLHCFIPITFDADGNVESLVVGMNYISTDPPEGGRFVGIVHEDGQGAVDAWCEANQSEFERLRTFAQAALPGEAPTSRKGTGS